MIFNILKMKYKNIIFDFDGTLADTAELTIETMHRTNEVLKLSRKSDEECRSMIGYRLEKIPSILWPDISDISERYVATFREIYKTTKDSFKIRTYPFVVETLAVIEQRGIRMAVASSRSKISLQELCSELHLGKYFEMMVGGGDVENGKPAADAVNLILKIQGWNKDETLVVGDMNVDVLMGKAAGADACGVTYGNGSVADLKEVGPDFIISDFRELYNLLGLDIKCR